MPVFETAEGRIRAIGFMPPRGFDVLVGSLPATDPRVVSTADAIRSELTVDGLAPRYRPEGSGVDGLAAGEGCSSRARSGS